MHLKSSNGVGWEGSPPVCEIAPSPWCRGMEDDDEARWPLVLAGELEMASTSVDDPPWSAESESSSSFSMESEHSASESCIGDGALPDPLSFRLMDPLRIFPAEEEDAAFFFLADVADVDFALLHVTSYLTISILKTTQINRIFYSDHARLHLMSLPLDPVVGLVVNDDEMTACTSGQQKSL